MQFSRRLELHTPGSQVGPPALVALGLGTGERTGRRRSLCTLRTDRAMASYCACPAPEINPNPRILLPHKAVGW